MNRAALLERWTQPAVLVLGAILLLAGLGTPGLWEPWEMDRAYLASALNAPPEVLVALEADDAPLEDALEDAVAARGGVLRRPDAATIAGDPATHLRMVLDMARNRVAAAVVLDARVLGLGGPDGEAMLKASRIVKEALGVTGRSPVIVLTPPELDAERDAIRAGLLAHRAEQLWVTAWRASPLHRLPGARSPQEEGLALRQRLEGDPQLLAAIGADAPRLKVLSAGDLPALKSALVAGLSASRGVVQFRDNGELRTFAPLDTWLRAASFNILGQSEFAARLPGVLMALAALAILLGVLRLVFSARVALLAGLVAITTPLFYDQARIVSGEPGFMLALTLTGASLLLRAHASRPGWAIPWIYLGLGLLFGVLSKGLFGLAVITAMTLVDPLVRASRCPLSWAPAALGAALTGLVALWVGSSQPGDFASQLSLHQALFSDGPTAYFRSFDLVIRNLGFGLAPWSPIVVVAVGLLTFGALARGDRRGLAVATWFFLPLLALMITLKDDNHFIYAAAPAAATAVAIFADRLIARGYRSYFVAIALLFMFFILRNELKQSPEPLVASLTIDPPFSNDGAIRFPEGLELGFLFKTMLALAAAFCLLHIGRLGAALPAVVRFLRRPRPLAIATAIGIVLSAIALLTVVGRPHGRAMGSAYLDVVGPGQRAFVKRLISFEEPIFLVGIVCLLLLAAIGVWRLRRGRPLAELLARRPRLGTIAWAAAAGSWGLLAIGLIASTRTPSDFWGETLASSRTLPALVIIALGGVAAWRLSRARLEGLLAAVALGALLLATRFIRDAGAAEWPIALLLVLGTCGAALAFGLRIADRAETYALGVAGFIAAVLLGFAAPLLDRYGDLAVLMAQGGPVVSTADLLKSPAPWAILVLIGGLHLSARGVPLLEKVRLGPARLQGWLEGLQRGSSLVVALLVVAFVITGLNVFKFQRSFAVNVSQKHIIETWLAAAGQGAEGAPPEARILRHGSLGRSGGKDTNFYTSGFAEVRDRQGALKVLLGAEDQIISVETRDGTEYRHFPGYAGGFEGEIQLWRGFASQVEAGRLVDRDAAWEPGALKGFHLHDSGGQSWPIVDNDATSVTVSADGRWNFDLKPATRAAYLVADRPLGRLPATGRARERRALLIPADSLSEINHAYRKLSGGPHLPILEGSSYRVLLATSHLEAGEAQQNRLALATFDDASFRALNRPNLRRVWGSFEDTIQVVGYDVDKLVVGGNDRLGLTVYYKTLKPVRKSLKLFLHLDRLGATNRIHGDHWPLNPTRHSEDNKNCTGCYRTDHWLPGDIVADTYEIDIPEGSSAGDYMIWLGFYTPGPDTRLKVTSWDEQNCKHDGADRLGIGTVTVR